MNMKAIIVDDEKHCRITLEKLIEWEKLAIEIVEKCNSVESAKKAILEHKPVLVFLDIEMPEKNGFDLLYELEDINFDVIFTTAYDQFAIEAFKTNAVAYLLKPIDRSELKLAVQKVLDKRNEHFSQEKLLKLYALIKSEDKFFNKVAIPTSEGVEFVKVEAIIRCEAEGNYTRIFINDDKDLFVAKTLKQIEALLKEYHFLRPHNSHLVNMKYIKSYNKGSGGSLKLEDGSLVPVSRYRKEEINKLL